MSRKKKTDGMKQLKLQFTAAKRTGSALGAGARGEAKAKVLRKTSPVPVPAVASAKPTPVSDCFARSMVATAQSARRAKMKAEVLDNADDYSIKIAEDVGLRDSESLSSGSTFKIVESVKNSESASITRLSNAVAAPAKKDAVSLTTPISTPKGKMNANYPAKEKAKANVKQEDLAEDAIMEKEEEPGDAKSTTVFKQSNVTDADIAKRVESNVNANITNAKGQGPTELRVKAVEWKKYHDTLKAKYGGLLNVNGVNENTVHQILRYFDNAYEYGPCIGLTRRDRWDRAQALGLNPPKEINDILNTIEGRTKDEYIQSVFYGQV